MQVRLRIEDTSLLDERGDPDHPASQAGPGSAGGLGGEVVLIGMHDHRPTDDVVGPGESHCRVIELQMSLAVLTCLEIAEEWRSGGPHYGQDLRGRGFVLGILRGRQRQTFMNRLHLWLCGRDL